MIALERPFYKHFPELQGTNSDWLFSQFGNRSRKVAKIPFKTQYSDGLLALQLAKMRSDVI
jgi:hypothetical protein